MANLALLEMAAIEYWEDLSHDEQLAYLIAHPNSRFLSKEVAESWFDRLSPFKKKEYLEEHPHSSFAEHLKSLPGNIQQSFRNLSTNAQQAIQDWHEKTAAQKATAVAGAAIHAGKRVAHHVGEYGKHEYHMYKGAGAALSHLARGKSWRDLHPRHKKALRDALIHAGITAGSMALGDATGGSGLSAIGHLAGAFGAEHAHHTLLLGGGEVAYKLGKDALKKATAAEQRYYNLMHLVNTSSLTSNNIRSIVKFVDKASISNSKKLRILKKVEARIV